MSVLASAFGALEGAGVTAYEVASGAPVSVSSVGGLSSISVGSVFSGTSGTIILVLIAVALIFFASNRRSRS